MRFPQIARLGTVIVVLGAAGGIAGPAYASPPPAGWTVSASPNGAAGDSVLAGVTARTPTSAWAVGVTADQTVPGSARPFIIQRDATGWHIRSAPALTAGSGRLAAVDALSSKDIWAVGATSGPDAPLALHYDGKAWHTVATPSLDGPAQFDAVDARSAKDVWAVGRRTVAGDRATLIEHWDGRRWSVVPSPTVSDIGGSYLTGVAAVAANDVWAVGASGDEFIVPYVLHWDGRVWSTVAVPRPPVSAEVLDLRGITARSATDVWAVGGNHLVEHFDGQRWSVVPAPAASDDPDATTTFSSVAARSASDVWTVGVVSGDSGPRTVTEHWDGTAWSVVASPNPSPTANTLASVAIPPAGAAVAVGYEQARNPAQTLVLNEQP